MIKWLLVAFIIIFGSIAAILISHSLESNKTNELYHNLLNATYQYMGDPVEFNSFAELPPPVTRYFKHVLTNGQDIIQSTRFNQSGELRSNPTEENWSTFTAQQLVMTRSFIWNAKIKLPLGVHIRVIDSYVDGKGAAYVSFNSAVGLGSESDITELNSGALHRYLAEGVWSPTALLPRAGVVWTAIDENTALATLADGNNSVSLEFRFNETGEVVSIYTPGRYSKVDDGYELMQWEGHFDDYREIAGMRIPMFGEVGWYVDGELELVWKGKLLKVEYEFHN